MRDYSFGNFLHELRLHRGLTQYQLGALVGVSDKAVSKWENGSSKPQSSILYKLSEVLGISVDELLSCKYHSLDKKDRKGIFAMKKQLWNKAFEAMCEQYGTPTPLEIANRFLAEQAEMQDSEMIVYFHLLSTLAAAARTHREYFSVRGAIGASFIAYLLGATEISPLKPHYFCPSCHITIFDNSAEDGWDLPPRYCSCGKIMSQDGHNLPFESNRDDLYQNARFTVSVSPNFYIPAKSLVEEYFKSYKLIFTERVAKQIITITISNEASEFSLTICANESFARYPALEDATAVCQDRVPFYCNKVLGEFGKCNTDGIPDFESEFAKNMLMTVKPKSFHELIQMIGFCRGMNTWMDNGDKLIEKGYPVSRMIAYRDDVFNYIQDIMLSKGLIDTGLAYKIMEDVWRGRYVEHGVPMYIRSILEASDVEDWFIDSISKIHFLISKAQGVSQSKQAATLMWYKIHYPKEFNEIML